MTLANFLALVFLVFVCLQAGYELGRRDAPPPIGAVIYGASKERPIPDMRFGIWRGHKEA
jgi:hypothetical protein